MSWRAIRVLVSMLAAASSGAAQQGREADPIRIEVAATEGQIILVRPRPIPRLETGG